MSSPSFPREGSFSGLSRGSDWRARSSSPMTSPERPSGRGRPVGWASPPLWDSEDSTEGPRFSEAPVDEDRVRRFQLPLRQVLQSPYFPSSGTPLPVATGPSSRRPPLTPSRGTGPVWDPGEATPSQGRRILRAVRRIVRSRGSEERGSVQRSPPPPQAVRYDREEGSDARPPRPSHPTQRRRSGGMEPSWRPSDAPPSYEESIRGAPHPPAPFLAPNRFGSVPYELTFLDAQGRRYTYRLVQESSGRGSETRPS